MIELLIVTAIFTFISSLVLASHARFGGIITLENFAYDVALSIRQAQVYSIAVQRYGVDNYGAAYGIHFDIASPTTYELFGDATIVNGLYDCANPGDPSCELLQATSMLGGYHISDLCIRMQGSADETCDGIDTLDIAFKRPEPDAYIRSGGSPVLHEAARIVVLSPRGEAAVIAVEATGQISVRRNQ